MSSERLAPLPMATTIALRKKDSATGTPMTRRTNSRAIEAIIVGVISYYLAYLFS